MIALIALPVIGAQAEEKEYRPGAVQNSGLDIDVWVDNDDGVYYEGESITIYFHANRDCFVAIYSLDTRGQINLLYPAGPWDNGFVYGGEVYAIPADYDEYELIVTGPEGLEYIQAVASVEEMNIPDWYDGTSLRADYNDNDEDFLDHINGRYFTSRWESRYRALDRTTVYVKTPHYYYKPVYVPHQWYDYPNYSMVYFDYPFGAEIYIDGIYFGIAPLWIPRVMIGWRWVTIYDRYGYCWEEHVHFVHDQTIRLDRTRVVTSRSKVSRFKDVRTQTKKYSRSSYLLSDKKVTKVRTSDRDDRTKYKDSKYRTGKSKTDTRDGRYTTKKGTKEKTKRIEDSWNRKRPNTNDSKKSGKRSTDGSKKSGSDYRKSGSDSRKSTGDSKRGSSDRQSKSSIKRSTGSSKGSSPKSIDRSSGSSRKSTGSSKSSVKSTPKSGSSGKSSGSKSSSSTKKGGNISKSSGSSKSSSVGRSSSGRSSSSKSSSRSSSKSGGSRR